MKEYNEDLKKYFQLPFIDWNMLKNKSILISGASGLIGKYLIDLLMMANNNLNLNCKVIGIGHSSEKAKKMFNYFDNKLFNYIEQDVCSAIKYDEKIDYIIHMASNTSPIQYSNFPIETLNTNILGCQNLLNLSVDKKITKFIFISSFEIYGNVQNISKIKEDNYGSLDCTLLRSCYPESKRLAENMCIAYSTEKEINTSILRLSRVFGPTMNPNSTLSISQFLKCGLNKEDIILKSNGEQDYSFNYVGDVATAIIQVMLHGKNKEAYNVSSKMFDCKLKEFASCVAEYCGTNIIYDIPTDIELKSFSNSTMTILDSSKLQDLNWYTISNLKQKIFDTLEILKKKGN